MNNLSHHMRENTVEQVLRKSDDALTWRSCTPHEQNSQVCTTERKMSKEYQYSLKTSTKEITSKLQT